LRVYGAFCEARPEGRGGFDVGITGAYHALKRGKVGAVEAALMDDGGVWGALGGEGGLMRRG